MSDQLKASIADVPFPFITVDRKGIQRSQHGTLAHARLAAIGAPAPRAIFVKVREGHWVAVPA